MSVGCGSTCRLISMRICLVHFSFLWLPSFGRKIVEVLAGGCEVVDPLQLMELVMAMVKLCLAFSPVFAFHCLGWFTFCLANFQKFFALMAKQLEILLTFACTVAELPFAVAYG